MDNLNSHLEYLRHNEHIPINHVNYLLYLKNLGFEPKVVYDIGSCLVQWTDVAKQIWPDAKFILFDAFQPAEFLYSEYDYNIGVLSDEDDKIVKFYQNNYNPGGNSYYREAANIYGETFPKDQYIEMQTKKLDTIVKERGFPLPDFVKIDVQGSEIDVIRGGLNTINNASRMIVELQSIVYNEGAYTSDVSLPIIESSGWNCCDPLFQNNGPDGDYGFIRE